MSACRRPTSTTMATLTSWTWRLPASWTNGVMLTTATAFAQFPKFGAKLISGQMSACRRPSSTIGVMLSSSSWVLQESLRTSTLIAATAFAQFPKFGTNLISGQMSACRRPSSTTMATLTSSWWCLLASSMDGTTSTTATAFAQFPKFGTNPISGQMSACRRPTSTIGVMLTSSTWILQASLRTTTLVTATAFAQFPTTN